MTTVPCPFCGKDKTYLADLEGVPSIICYACGATGPRHPNGQRNLCTDDAIAAWDSQAMVEDLRQEVEDVTEDMKTLNAELTEARNHIEELRGEIADLQARQP